MAAPYLAFDGMNEKGVAIALLAVPEAQPGDDPAKVTLNSTAVIRLVLDKAATLDEAILLMSQYNIYFSADIPCQYLIADASGKSAIVVYWAEKMQVQYKSEAFQIASNFIPLPEVMLGEGYSEFERFDMVEKALLDNGGRITETRAAQLLMQVGVYAPDGTDKLQWSVVYNLSAAQASHFVHRDLETNVISVIEKKKKA